MRVKGFSLIEVLVVLSILAIVNFVLFPNIAKIQDSAKVISAKSIARNVMVALEQYYFIYQVYPDGTGVSIDVVLDELILLELLDSMPINPFTGDEYSSGDDSGLILYTYSDTNGVELTGYGRLNEAIIFDY